jgi:hypothetical protein
MVFWGNIDRGNILDFAQIVCHVERQFWTLMLSPEKEGKCYPH